MPPWFAGGDRSDTAQTSGTHRPGRVMAAESSQQQLYQPQQQQQRQQVWVGSYGLSSSIAQQKPNTATAAAGVANAAAASNGEHNATITPLPAGTNVAELMAATKQLEDELLVYCQEKDELNKEYAKMPLGAGRTVRERQRKVVIEERLEEVDKLISRIRMQLKKYLGK
eukprot:GHRR01017625.1.p1 GENE.GHRR01017625.1~~GHRR01017625.1.p1  ORF type:complete len:169 (+),score=73.95 GHRR01017625.1:524-1030(+)